MKNITKYTALAALMVAVCFWASCTMDAPEADGKGEGTRLRMGVSFGASSRLAELSDPEQMNDTEIEGKDYGLNHIGLYIYYTADYNNNDLSKPYIRNMECEVRDGELMLLIPDGADEEDAFVYIYDQMTIVAFYPYNADPGEFKTRADEQNYPITRYDYGEQYYIPYRAQTTVNPTNAFYTSLTFTPKHTYKIEIVLVSDDPAGFPAESGIKILPGNDAVGNTVTATDGSREAWFDKVNPMPDGGGGSNVMQYIAYLWTDQQNRNLIKQGDVLIESGDFRLIASRDVTTTEQTVYRYGYNISQNEMFIPTSSTIIHDIPTLQSVNSSNGVAYQACDIDLGEGGNWEPLTIFGGRYDGGGHRISNMTVDKNDDSSFAGLFGLVQGGATVCNVNLIDPTVTLATTADSCSVGALVGRLNAPLSAEDQAKLIGNLPPGLSPVVKQALLDDLLKGLANSQSNVVGCRVENPTIVVNGKKAAVGSVVGLAGASDEHGTYKARIWDSYALGGSITVNGGTSADNEETNAGGFVGLNNAYITRSYTTTSSIDAKYQAVTTPPEPEAPIVDKSTGFAIQGDAFTEPSDSSISDSYSTLADANPGVSQLGSGTWPAWPRYTSYWPTNTIGWLNAPSTSFWYDMGRYNAANPVYPTLQFERK